MSRSSGARRPGERPLILDKGVSRCLANLDRAAWEDAISLAGGSVSDAAADCGIEGTPKGTKILWGQSVDEARSSKPAIRLGRSGLCGDPSAQTRQVM